ncbi:cytochrome c [Maritimibacter sp. DP1N21-5]|uniref:c-type cytochrome n=1 Tax=Maritimibacter sp. DP1N21-5 TaxID=2836867 RepID=UPI001C4711AC|nr:cytochrome c [Maritimibacter sp. DP1N21-5]MBV7407570.1 cytochrome c [Maritimibacter sp. DP1N21-5]
MKTFKLILAAATMTAIGAAYVHAQEDVIKARQAAMKTIGAQMKVLSDMSKGAAPFDATAANEALATMAATAETVPVLFETEAIEGTDTDASSDIWANWDDFVSKAEALQTAAQGASVSDESSLGSAMGAVGGACGSCHKPYKL